MDGKLDMKTILFAALAVVASGALAQTIDIGRGEIPLVVPTGYDETKPAPLIVLIHGYTGSGQQQESYFKLSQLADEYGFFFIAPDGTVEKAGEKHRFWNAGTLCCNFQGSTVDDVTYLKRLIDAVGGKYNIDPDRIYMSGHSNGGFMVHRMAYEFPETIAAIVALNGSAPMNFTKPPPAKPVSVLHIHGTRDRLNDYAGGDIRGMPYPSVMTGARNWAHYGFGNAAASELPERVDLDTNLAGDDTVVTQFADGKVEVWTILEGGHIPAFPGDFNRRVVEWMLAHPKE